MQPEAQDHPDGGPPLTWRNPLSITIPSSDGQPIVADVSMGEVTYGDVIAGLAFEGDLVPFGGEQAHKAFALARPPAPGRRSGCGPGTAFAARCAARPM